jgi:hypothetical protein
VAHYYWRAGSCSFFNAIGPLTPDQEKAFKEAIVLFLGVVLSILGDNLVDAYLHIRDGKNCGMPWRPNLAWLMPAANGMLWRSSITTRYG